MTSSSTKDIDLSTIDFYHLLNIPPTSTESEIRRAYRKTTLLYHPDRVTPTRETLEKFQHLQNAIEVLTDAGERARYDAIWEAKRRRAAETAAMDGRRRKMVEELERREKGEGTTSVATVAGVKRGWTERELEIKRIGEENRRKREVRMAQQEEEVRRAQQEEVMKKAEKEVVVVEGDDNDDDDEVDRSVKVQWVKEGDGLDIDEEMLVEIFPVGEVETVVPLKDKRRRLEGRDKKVVMGTAVLVFKSLIAAKKAVARGKTDELESVTWAAQKEKRAEPT